MNFTKKGEGLGKLIPLTVIVGIAVAITFFLLRNMLDVLHFNPTTGIDFIDNNLPLAMPDNNVIASFLIFLVIVLVSRFFRSLEKFLLSIAVIILATSVLLMAAEHPFPLGYWPYNLKFLLPLSAIIIGLFITSKRWRTAIQPEHTGEDRRQKNGVFGNAKFATYKEMTTRFPDDGEVVIGEAYIQKIGTPFGEKPAGRASLLCDTLSTGSTHGMIISGSGGYKTTSVVLPTLWLTNYSCVVFDPKREISRKTQRVRETIHNKISYCLDPNDSSKDGFNALKWIDMNSEAWPQDLFQVATWLIGESRAGSENRYFENSATSLVHALLIDLMISEEISDADKNLLTFASTLFQGVDKLQTLLLNIAESSKSEAAKMISAPLADLDHRTFSSVMSTAQTSAHWLTMPHLAKLVSYDGFDVEEIHNQQADLFIQTDLETLKDHPGLGRVILGGLLAQRYRTDEKSRNGRVIFLLDEVARLGPMTALETARDVGRSAGITLLLVYQSEGQIYDQWGQKGTNKWYENVAWRSYSGVGDLATAEMVSKSIGEFTIQSKGTSSSSGTSSRMTEMFGTGSTGRSTSMTEQRRRLITPEEILHETPADAQFVFMPGEKALFVGRALYFRRPEMAKWIDD